MQWPVRGNVLLDYSMDQTIYFPTLDQYKCNPGLVIQSDVSTPVGAPANARILEVGSNEEIGNYVVMDLGNEYTATCGQLKEVCAAEGEYLKKEILAIGSPKVKTVRGMGLMLGIVVDKDERAAMVSQLMEKGVLVLTAGTEAIRLLPPLVITKEEMDEAIVAMREVF